MLAHKALVKHRTPCRVSREQHSPVTLLGKCGAQVIRNSNIRQDKQQQKYMRQERHTLPAPGRAASSDNETNHHLRLSEERKSNCTHGHGGAPVLSVNCAHMGSQNLYSQNINRKL